MTPIEVQDVQPTDTQVPAPTDTEAPLPTVTALPTHVTTPTGGETEPERISFALGGTSALVSGTLEAAGSYSYVLNAAEGQEMTVNLTAVPPFNGRLIIWGEDGTVLVSGMAVTRFFSRELPVAQDYYIEIQANPDQAVSYQLQVIIPPKGQSAVDDYQPLDSAACTSMFELMNTHSGLQTEQMQTLYHNPQNDKTGIACGALAYGRLADIGDPEPMWHAVFTALEDAGWTMDTDLEGSLGLTSWEVDFTRDSATCVVGNQIETQTAVEADGEDLPDLLVLSLACMTE